MPFIKKLGAWTRKKGSLLLLLTLSGVLTWCFYGRLVEDSMQQIPLAAAPQLPDLSKWGRHWEVYKIRGQVFCYEMPKAGGDPERAYRLDGSGWTLVPTM